MKKDEYLILCLAEECAEVIQRCTKSSRFGLDEIQEGQDLTNAQRLAYEYNDLTAVMEALREIVDIPDIGCKIQIREKKEKLLKYMEFSRNQGILED